MDGTRAAPPVQVNRAPAAAPSRGKPRGPHREDVIMSFRPLHDRILVRRSEEETKSAGGIILPDTATEKPNRGEVVSVGPGRRTEDGDLVPLDLAPGDRILFGKYGGTDVRIDGEDLVVLKESDVLGVVTA